MTDQILLTGVTARGYHGVLPEERVQGQPFVVDITLEVDLRDAADSDDLADTVSYADVAAQTVAIIGGPAFDLIETLADRIASAALAHDRVQAVEVTVHKPEAPVGVPFGDVSVRVRRERSVPVVVALGANQGTPDALVATLLSAVRQLGRVEGLAIRGVSRLFTTKPVGGPAQPDYLNAVLVADTRLAPGALLRELHTVEDRHGRRREVRWGPRTLDLDLIQYGDPAAGTDVAAATEALTLPHPRAAERAFVLAPWLDADPAAVLRVGPDSDGEPSVLAVARLLADLPPQGIGAGPPWSPTW